MDTNDLDVTIVPRLVVTDVDDAIKMYETVFGATLLERFEDDKGRVVHASVKIGNSNVSFTETVSAWKLYDPTILNGSPVLLRLSVPDPDAIARNLVSVGGEVIINIEDRPYGFREGRVQDKFGHLWILSRPLQ